MSWRPFPSGSGHGARATDMYTAKGCEMPTRFTTVFRALDRGGNRVGVTHISFDGMDLSDVAHG
jgi:hypothetical protein